MDRHTRLPAEILFTCLITLRISCTDRKAFIMRRINKRLSFEQIALKFLLFALLLLCPMPGRAAHISRTAEQFTLPLPFSYIADADTPEGSWLAPLLSHTSATTGPIPFGETIPAGTAVRIFVKWLDY